MTRKTLDSTAFNIVTLGVLSIGVIITLILALLAQSKAANAAKAAAAVAKTQAAQAHVEQIRLQDALCGLVVPIGQQPITAKVSALGRTLINGGRHAGVVISCPAPKGR